MWERTVSSSVNNVGSDVLQVEIKQQEEPTIGSWKRGVGLLEVQGRRLGLLGDNKLYSEPKRHCFDAKSIKTTLF